jgi:hypothetical protein
MPFEYDCAPHVSLVEKVYRGWFGDSAQTKIRESQRRKGFRAVFPDCKTLGY